MDDWGWLRMVAYFSISNFENIHYFHSANLLLNSNESCLIVSTMIYFKLILTILALHYNSSKNSQLNLKKSLAASWTRFIS